MLRTADCLDESKYACAAHSAEQTHQKGAKDFVWHKVAKWLAMITAGVRGMIWLHARNYIRLFFKYVSHNLSP